METKDVIRELRTKNGLSQDQLAQKLFVTRQAVSRWETGETVPNTQTLGLLSELFGVSVDTLLGSPAKLVCQCCGMPLEDETLGRNADGSVNSSYCKWCYADGVHTYADMDELIDVCVPHMAAQGFSEEQAREYMRQLLPTLDYWKRYEELGDAGEFEAFKQKLIGEINALGIEGMPKLEKLGTLVGSFIDLEYTLPGGAKARFLDPGATYLGAQLESEFGGTRRFGVAANMDFILVCTYEGRGDDPELVMYKKR